MTVHDTALTNERDRFLQDIQVIAGLGVYVLDMASRSWTSSVVLNEIFGIDDSFEYSTDAWVSLVHPQDRAMMADYFAREVVGRRQPFDKEYRIIRRVDGGERWVYGRGRLDLDAQGVPVRMIGTIQDITAWKLMVRSLQDSESRYRGLVELAVDGILIGTHEGVILDANRCLCEMFGMVRGELIGKRVGDMPFTRESIARNPFRFDLLQAGETVVTERSLVRSDGVNVVVEIRTKMMPDRNYQSIYRDITDRKQAEDDLRHLAETLEQRVAERTRALESANAALQNSHALLNETGIVGHVGGWELDLRTLVQVWTDEVYRIHEVERDYKPGLSDGLAFYAPESRPIIDRVVQRAMEHGEPFDEELQIITAKGRRRWVRVVGKMDADHRKMFGIFQDITERKVVDVALRVKNAALDRSVAQLRKLAAELTQAEERERKRLAGTLHDHLQPLLVASTIKASLLDRRATEKDHAREVQEILDLLGEALEASRSLTTDLYPPVLLDAGLGPGLRWLADRMKLKHGVEVRLTMDESMDIPEPLSILLFRGVRELLLNVVKHANTSAAVVDMVREGEGALRVSVRDQGCGFLSNSAAASSPSEGFGLFHLREHLAYMGGSLGVTSELGKGTQVTIKVPTLS